MTKFTHVAYEIEPDGCPVGPSFRSLADAETWVAGQRARGSRHVVGTLAEFGREVELWRESQGLDPAPVPWWDETEDASANNEPRTTAE